MLTCIYIDIRNLDKRAMVIFKFLEPMKRNSLSSSGAGEQIPEPAFRSTPAASLHARGPGMARLLCWCTSHQGDWTLSPGAQAGRITIAGESITQLEKPTPVKRGGCAGS